jgi:VanZ family protein
MAKLDDHVQITTPPWSVWALRALGCLALALMLSFALSDNFSRPEFIARQDRVEHVLAFALLGFLFAWRASWAGFVTVALVLTGVAFSVEILQQTVTLTREAHLSDAIASMVGLMLGLAGALASGALLSRLRPTQEGRCQRA